MVKAPIAMNLRQLYFALENKGFPVKARAPGSLGQSVVNVHEWVIGSLQATILNTSVFVFPNGKIKVSGGSAGYCEEEVYESWLKTHKVNPVLKELFIKTDEASVDISLINGSHTLSSINMLNFYEICDYLDSNKLIVDKPSMLVNPSKRGRICSVSVKLPNVRGSMRFDHSGKLQLFGFKAHNDMKLALETLESNLKTI